jgi:hypothetical protein
MNSDLLILIVAWIITIIMLILFIPKDKLREAQLVFIFIQLITWFIGLLVVEFRLLEYPVEFFKYATKSSFTFEYFIYPAICAVFNMNYPVKKTIFKQFMYYFDFCSIMTIIEVLCERYTNIITYLHWTWYVTWITLFITFYLSRQYYLWFFRLKESELA